VNSPCDVRNINRISLLLSPSVPSRQLAILVASLLLLPGCSTYQNVTAYFNTYYNANKLFDDAVKEVDNVPQKTRDTAYFVSYTIQPATKTKFDKVIEKCSKLIQFYPNSSWIDAAVYMIAVSYVYKDESESAIRKFKDLYENFPTSSYLRKAKLWHAKALYFMKKDDEALQLTKDLFEAARAEGDNDVLLEMLMLEAQIYFERHEYDQAAAKYVLAVEVSGDKNLRAIAQYLLGFTYERMGEYARAATAYSEVRRFKPDFNSVFRARLKYAHMLSLSKQYDRALGTLDELIDEKLASDQVSLVDLEIANTDWVKGDSASAFALYSYIDTTYRGSDASAKANFQRGLIFEKEFSNFKKALDHYTKARDQYAASEINPIAQQKTATLTNYFKFRENIKRYDSLLFVALHPDSVKASLHDTSSGQPDSSASRGSAGSTIDSLERRADALRAETAPRPPRGDAPLPGPPDTLGRSVAPPPDENEDDDAQVGRRRQALPDSSGMTRRDRDKVRPFDPRLAMKDSLSGRPGLRDSSKSAGITQPKAVQAVLTPDSLRSLLARNKFELAGLFYLELNLPDSGLAWFQHVVDAYPTSPFIARSLYAMAEIYRNKGDSLIVDSLYRTILTTFEKSEYATQVRKVLKMDSLKSAEDRVLVAYEKAEQLLAGDNPDLALQHLKSLAESHAALSHLPKILYAIGWIYENVVFENDSAAEWYKRVVKEYPSSMYAADVQGKLAVKADPKSLSQYVRIKEIQALRRPEAPRTARTLNQAKGKNPTQEDVGGRNKERNQDEDDEVDQQDDEQETPEEPDDNN